MFTSGENDQDGILGQASAAFAQGEYAAVVGLLDGRAAGGRALTLLGVALRRTGQLAAAAYPLQQAASLGDEEGLVEYGNQLRLLGRFAEACVHFEAAEPLVLSRDLHCRLLRWWGVAQFQGGATEAGLVRTERAWHGYVALGDAGLTAQVAQSLAQMHAVLGHDARAMLLLREAVRVLPAGPDPAPRLAALKNLADLQVKGGEYGAAQATLLEARATLQNKQAPRLAAHLLCSEAELCRLTGQQAAYALALEQLLRLAGELDDHQLRLWATSRAAEQASGLEQHARAVTILHGCGQPMSQWPAELWATDGVLRRRRGDFAGAAESLARAADGYRQMGAEPELARTLLHQAASALRTRDEAGVAALLGEALAIMLRLGHLHAFRPDLEELDELIKFALLDPDLAPYTGGLLDRLAIVAGSRRLPEDGAMRLQVQLLGRSQVVRDGEAIHLRYAGSALLLAYLALSPERTRAQIQLDLFPDRAPREASGYVRQLLWELRDRLGPEVYITEGSHARPTYRLGPRVNVELDFTQFLDSIERGEVARALALYRGEFAPGLTGPWVEQRREEALLALSFELRNQMAAARGRGDLRRVVLYANQLLAADPFDLEVLEARVEAAQAVSSARDLALYTAALNHARFN